MIHLAARGYRHAVTVRPVVKGDCGVPIAALAKGDSIVIGVPAFVVSDNVCPRCVELAQAVPIEERAK